MTEQGYRKASLLWAMALLLLCIAHGVWAVSGARYPPDLDDLRDIGLTQGILDGDLFGDPAYAGEIRYYPPLVLALAAASSWLFGIRDLPAFWVQAGPWINLLAPATFFFAARQVLSSAGPAAAALTVFVLFDSAVARPWVTGGYTPWPFIPNISQSLFFLTLWLILAHQGSHRWRDAAFIGAAIGVTFLAHPVPAILLTVIVTAVAFGVRGLQIRTVAWLALVAAVQLAVMSPYLGPIALRYPSGIVNFQPGLWVDLLMVPDFHAMARMALVNLPGLLALIGMVFLYRRGIRFQRGAALALGVWIILPLVVLGRHYACGLGTKLTGVDVGSIAACRLFVVPVHHYHLYLQSAWAMLIGFVIWHLLRLFVRPGRRWRAVVVAVVVLVAAAGGGWCLVNRRFDDLARYAALHPDEAGLADWDAYRWILMNAKPKDTFVTPLNVEGEDPAVFAVYAAGRKLVAAPSAFSNPYVLWEPREAQRQQIIQAVTGDVNPTPLCQYKYLTLWVLLPIGAAVEENRVEAVQSTGHNTIYRVRRDHC